MNHEKANRITFRNTLQPKGLRLNLYKCTKHRKVLSWYGNGRTVNWADKHVFKVRDSLVILHNDKGCLDLRFQTDYCDLKSQWSVSINKFGLWLFRCQLLGFWIIRKDYLRTNKITSLLLRLTLLERLSYQTVTSFFPFSHKKCSIYFWSFLYRNFSKIKIVKNSHI